MTMSEAGTLFREGRLDDAVAAAGGEVRRAPLEIAARVLLAELLVFAGELERADAVLVAADADDPGAAVAVAEFRQLLRAASARRQLATEGRVPEFLGAPTAAQRRALDALVALRAGDLAAAAAAAAAAELARPRAAGSGDGGAFADFRDADDLCAGSFEVLTSTGRYLWIPTERVASLDFGPQRRPRDLVWRRCSMSVRDGPDGEVYLPALYEAAPHGGPVPDELRLGRGTRWTEAAPVRGIGQRMFLAGEDGVAASALRHLEFA